MQLREIRIQLSNREGAKAQLLPIANTEQSASDGEGHAVALRCGEVEVDRGAFESWYRLAAVVTGGTVTMSLNVLAGCIATWLMDQLKGASLGSEEEPVVEAQPRITLLLEDGAVIQVEGLSRRDVLKALEGYRSDRDEA